jgi:hypothetical protein
MCKKPPENYGTDPTTPALALKVLTPPRLV